MEIMVNSKNILFQQKFQKKLYHFNRNSQFEECNVKDNAVAHLESDTKTWLQLPVLLGIRLYSKTSDSFRLSATLVVMPGIQLQILKNW